MTYVIECILVVLMCWAHQVVIFGKLLNIFLGMAKSRHYKVSNINGEKSNIDKIYAIFILCNTKDQR